MKPVLFAFFALMATGCGKNACEELAECLDVDEGEAADATDAELEACEALLDESDC
jgi:hypothetical protein